MFSSAKVKIDISDDYLHYNIIKASLHVLAQMTQTLLG